VTDLTKLNELTTTLAKNPLSIPSNPGPQSEAEAFRVNMASWRATSVEAIRGLRDEIKLLRGDVHNLAEKVDEHRDAICEKYDGKIAKLWDKVHAIDVRVGGIAAVVGIAVTVGLKLVGAA